MKVVAQVNDRDEKKNSFVKFPNGVIGFFEEQVPEGEEVEAMIVGVGKKRIRTGEFENQYPAVIFLARVDPAKHVKVLVDGYVMKPATESKKGAAEDGKERPKFYASATYAEGDKKVEVTGGIAPVYVVGRHEGGQVPHPCEVWIEKRGKLSSKTVGVDSLDDLHCVVEIRRTAQPIVHVEKPRNGKPHTREERNRQETSRGNDAMRRAFEKQSA